MEYGGITTPTETNFALTFTEETKLTSVIPEEFLFC
jgi:hypothetical protein